MIAGSDFVRYLLSETGLILLFLAAAVWAARRPASVRARWTAVACALFFALVSIYAGQYAIGRTIAAGFKPFRADDAVPDRRTAIVVLGSGGLDVEDWDGGTFSVVDRAAATRVLEASRVFRMIDPAIVISSGGNAHTGDIVRPTGETMRDALVTIGVPRERIMVETVSRTTRDE